jgi:Phage integrase family
MHAAKRNRWGHRDAAMILVAYGNGLRASELVDLPWDQVEFRTATLHVRRVKQGTPGQVSGSRRRIARPAVAPARAEGAVQYCEVRLAWSSGRQEGQAGLQCAPAYAQTRRRLQAFATMGTTPSLCRLIWATATSSTQCGTLSCRRRGSRIPGASECGVLPQMRAVRYVRSCPESRHSPVILRCPLCATGGHCSTMTC